MSLLSVVSVAAFDRRRWIGENVQLASGGLRHPGTLAETVGALERPRREQPNPVDPLREARPGRIGGGLAATGGCFLSCLYLVIQYFGLI